MLQTRLPVQPLPLVLVPARSFLEQVELTCMVFGVLSATFITTRIAAMALVASACAVLVLLALAMTTTHFYMRVLIIPLLLIVSPAVYESNYGSWLSLRPPARL
jgi:hypothetical protein